MHFFDHCIALISFLSFFNNKTNNNRTWTGTPDCACPDILKGNWDAQTCTGLTPGQKCNATCLGTISGTVSKQAELTCLGTGYVALHISYYSHSHLLFERFAVIR